MKTFRVLGALLAYPDAALRDAIPELRAALVEERLLPADALRGLGPLLDEIEAAEGLDLAERYVQLFDRTRALSLHLFEHVHGESRDRGQAMIDLSALYERHGLALAVPELPDYLPLFLEFLSLLPLEEARALLAEPAGIIAALGERVERRGSAYAGVFRAIGALAGALPEGAGATPAGDDREAGPDDLARLDAEWEERPVSFGPGGFGPGFGPGFGQGGDGCGRAADMLRRMGAPAVPAVPPGRE